MVGKWGAVDFLFGLAITAFVFQGDNFVHAYVVETTSLIQPTELKLDLNSSSKINEVTAPLTNLMNEAIKSLGMNPNVNLGTGTPVSPIKSPSQGTDFSRFFSSSNVSSNDLMGFLKEAAVTAINLTILIISITSQVLKGLLSVFNK